MSDELQFSKSEGGRPLRYEERIVIFALLSGCNVRKSRAQSLDRAHVIDLKDGGMGSIRFVRSSPRRLGKNLVRGQYVDADGILASIILTVDEEGDLFEMDFWKVDFSPLKQYPQPSDLEVIEAL